MIESTIRWVLRRPNLILLITLVVAGACSYGMRFLEFDANYQAYFSKQNPKLKAYETFQATYSKGDSILFVLAPRGGDVFTPVVLDAVETLTKAAWQIPHSRRVDSISNFQHSYAQGDNLIVQDLISGARHYSEAQLRELRRIALNEPLLRNRLVSPRAHVTGINVTMQLSNNTTGDVQQAVSYAQDLVRELHSKYPEIQVYLTGGTIMDHTFPEAALKDIKTLVPLVYLLIVLTMGLLLRSIGATLATVIIITLSATTGMGLAGWLGMRLTPPSVGAVTIIMTLAVADSIHILITLLQEMSRGCSKSAALKQSLRINARPIFLTSLTTAIGFLSMNYSDAPPFRDLGNITAMGVTAAYLYSILLLPALITVLPLRVKQGVAHRGMLMSHLSKFVIARRRPLFWGTGIAILVMALFIPRIELNDQFVEYFDESIRFRTDTDFVMANLTGIYQIEYSLDSAEPYGISEPVYLARLEAFAEWFKQRPEAVHVNSIVDIMKRLNMNMHEDKPQWYRLPEKRELAAQYLLLYELSLPYGLDLNDQINLDKSASRFTVTLNNLSTKEFRALEASAEQWLRDHVPASMFTSATSAAVMFAYISERNIRTMMAGSLLAIVLITITLILALRSIKLGVISIIPNVMPTIMAFGFWGLMVGQVGLVVSVIFAMALGIIVDDTVHFLNTYLHGRRHKGLDAEQAVAYAFSTVGTALWVTSAILVAGFLLLALSTFKLNASTGQLTAITIIFALLADFLFLPPLLMLFGKSSKEKMKNKNRAL